MELDIFNLNLEYLNWDSQQLGVNCGLIDGTVFEDYIEADILAEQISGLIEKSTDLDFITIKLSYEYIDVANKLIKQGALLIDTELVFVYSKCTDDALNFIANDCKLDFCHKIDPKAFLPLAQEMQFSRFFLDPKISTNKAVNLWEASIKNYCQGYADQLLIAYFNGQPCGIVTLDFKGPRQLRLHIVGVLKRYRGKGIGKLMLCEITKQYSKEYNICVETQSVNIPAQGLYKRAGFKFDTVKYILHYWR